MLLFLQWITSWEQLAILQQREERVRRLGRSPSCKLGKSRCGGRPGGRLKPDVKVTIEGGRSPRLGGDVVTSEDMSDFVVAYLEYEEHMHVVNEDGRRGAHEKARAGRFGDINDGC